MPLQKFARLLFVLGGLVLFPSFHAQAGQVSGEAGVESRLFFESPLQDVQNEQGVSVSLAPEYYHDFADDNQRFAIDLFFRFDTQDDERTHFDIRELYWRGTFGSADFYIGLRKVFWGVTESVHLVDIINQTDFVENIDGEDKLGQPMVSLTYLTDKGTFDLFYMPYFRERTFPGKEGRLRFELPVDTDNPFYHSGTDEWRNDFAVRWSHIVSDFDIALSHFEGTARETQFVPKIDNNIPVGLLPAYAQLSQTGLELQYIRNDWLWKLEAVSREQQSIRSSAFVGGFEYTLYGIFGSSADLGLVAEYQYDDRPGFVLTDNDLAIGTRYTFNDIQDTDILAVVSMDTDNGSIFGSIEGNRRIGDMWEIITEMRLMIEPDQTDPLYQFRKDSYIQFELTRYF